MVSKHNQQNINESDTHLNANFKSELRKCIESYYEALSHEREEINMTENIEAVKPTLAQLMKEHGLTDEQLADMTGVNKYVIRRIQQKRFKRVMVADVLKLSTALECMFDMSTSNENDEVKWIPETKIDPKKENGKSLRNIRKEYGITIKELAASTNLEESIIKKIERHDFTGVAPYEFAAIVQCLGRFFVEVFMQNPHETQPQ